MECLFLTEFQGLLADPGCTVGVQDLGVRLSAFLGSLLDATISRGDRGPNLPSKDSEGPEKPLGGLGGQYEAPRNLAASS